MATSRVSEIAATLQKAIHLCASDLSDGEYLELLDAIADQCTLDAEASREEEFRGKVASNAAISERAQPAVAQALRALLASVGQRPEILEQLVTVDGLPKSLAAAKALNFSARRANVGEQPIGPHPSGEIEEVFVSHPAALAQCRVTSGEHGVVEVESESPTCG